MKIKLQNSTSIKNKLIKNFMLVIIISIFLLEILTINFIRNYYYGNIEELLTNQTKMSADFYNRYFSNSSLEENVLGNVDVFWNQTDAQVQIMDKSGKLLMDSIGTNQSNNVNEDVRKALNGEKGVWRGEVSYSSSKVMAVSFPLKRYGEVVGALRFITSLHGVDKAVNRIAIVFSLIGIFVVITGALLSIPLADSIINPIKGVTEVAEEMASGNFKIRSEKKYNDEVGKLSDTLNYMASEIVKKDQLKNEFISNVSHELRTPLTSIKGWAVTLKYDDIDRNMMKDGLDIIENECDRLSEMVEELLDFSKLISQKITLKKQWEKIYDVIEYIKKHMQPRAQRDGLTFLVEIEEEIPDLYIDKNRIKQVLINILDNSFKFTEREGKVTLRVYKEENNVAIEVEDNGCGISKEELPHVKEKFFKGKSSKSKNGIGLSICEEIIKIHEGSFNIESEVGKGTKVCILLPINNKG